jgi:hypothetical protein
MQQKFEDGKNGSKSLKKNDRKVSPTGQKKHVRNSEDRMIEGGAII